MSEREMEELKELLRKSLPAMGESELRRDLWPAMLQRLEEPRLRVPWWDWALLVATSLVILFFPGVIPALLYHL